MRVSGADAIALLLDSGGVLLLPDGGLLAATASEVGVSIEPRSAVRAMALASRDQGSRGDEEDFDSAWARHAGCTREQSARLWRRMAQEVSDLDFWSVVNPEAVQMLDALPDAVSRYVVSNAFGNAHAELVRAGLADRVSGVLDSGVVGVAKPDQRIYQMASTALGVPLERCVYVGDTLDALPGSPLHMVLYDPWDIYPDASEDYRRIASLTAITDHLPRTLEGKRKP